jgi:hypothetical protein
MGLAISGYVIYINSFDLTNFARILMGVYWGVWGGWVWGPFDFLAQVSVTFLLKA